jgi:hypothetical protein
MVRKHSLFKGLGGGGAVKKRALKKLAFSKGQIFLKIFSFQLVTTA